MDEIKRILELAGMAKPPTIVSSSTEKNGGINRKKANKMVDPKGWFKGSSSYYLNHQKESKSLRDYLALVEAEYVADAPYDSDSIKRDMLEIIEAHGEISLVDLIANTESLYPGVFDNTLGEQRKRIILNLVKDNPDKLEFSNGLLHWKGAGTPARLRVTPPSKADRWPRRR